MNPAMDAFWLAFLREKKRSEDTTYLESFHFDVSEASANTLLQLVLTGQKRATASSLRYYEATGVRMPQPKDYSIVTDWDGVPWCVIETTNVQLLPFHEMTYDICQREGEDETLASWIHNHISFFTQEGAVCGYSFTPDMPVVFEDFQVVYQRNEKD